MGKQLKMAFDTSDPEWDRWPEKMGHFPQTEQSFTSEDWKDFNEFFNKNEK